MTLKKWNIALIFGLIFLLSLAYSISQYVFGKTPIRDYTEIKSSGTLNIVTQYNSVDYYVSGDSITGVQYKLSNYIKERSGLNVEIHLENNFDVCIDKLQKNLYDVIALNIPITNENKKNLNFTVPITTSKQVLIQKKKNRNDKVPFIKNQIDLGNKTVFVAQNSPVILRLKNLSEEIAEPIYIEEIENYAAEHLIYMVSAGGIDYAVVDKEIATKNAKILPNIDIETEISFSQFQAWAVRQNAPVLLDSLNNWISDYLNR